MENNLSDKYYPIQIAAILKQIRIIERFGAHLAMQEACETIAGVMYEQAELLSLLEYNTDEKIKEWSKNTIKTQGRYYSSHFVAIRDALRLCKLVTELIEQTNGFFEDGGEQWLNSSAGKNILSNTISEIENYNNNAEDIENDNE